MSHPKDIIEELLFVTTRMAQCLEDHVIKGQKEGNNMQPTIELLKEFDRIYPLASNISNIWQ